MIKPVCERGKVCVFLEVKVEDYEIPIFPRSKLTKRGKQISYYCNNPKRFNEWQLPKLLDHEEKYRKCGFKVTDKLEQFIKS